VVQSILEHKYCYRGALVRGCDKRPEAEAEYWCNIDLLVFQSLILDVRERFE
jgi:hypothetical protein